jgi:probable phosphomutase (TIGR03848 family)
VTTFLLIRHATTDAVGRFLAGRRAGTHLNDAGRQEVRGLCDVLAGQLIGAICSSPLERARETAGPLAERLGLNLVVDEELTELDLGDWTGQTFEELGSDPRWRLFNTNRGGTRVPNGESMLEAQTRVVGYIEGLRDRHRDETVALVSHGDVIRAALLYYLGMPLDLFARIEISPASISVVQLHEHGPQVLAVNARVPAVDL